MIDDPALAAPVETDTERRYPSGIATFTKGLPHDALGEVDRTAFAAFLRRLATDGESRSAPDGLELPEPPPFAGREAAAEIVENYWMALARDTAFASYGGDVVASAAAAELSRLAYAGPRDGRLVTTKTLFRGSLPGDASGPYLSQFLFLCPRFGSERRDPRRRTFRPGADHLTTFERWLAAQNGSDAGPQSYDATRRYPRNGRDLAACVDDGEAGDPWVDAYLTLVDLDAPFNAGGVRRGSSAIRLAEACGPHIRALLNLVASRALKAAARRKWFVYRRLRPEAYAAALHNVATGCATYDVHPEALASEAVARVRARFGSELLPVTYPGGSPLQPAYPQAHATVAAACVTILKALFDGRARLAELLGGGRLYEPGSHERVRTPVVATADGLRLAPYDGSDACELTVGGELDKLASNVAFGRVHAGVAWRSDTVASLMLGESVALSVLRDPLLGYDDLFAGMTFARFFSRDGVRQETV